MSQIRDGVIASVISSHVVRSVSNVNELVQVWDHKIMELLEEEVIHSEELVIQSEEEVINKYE